ncbi:hypothetical protein AFLA70_6g007960 [Aspergillus flavus AF70]|nr:hypothetical protein AFLA70_6g007960 [Aspergillus flavus AF70]
MIPSDCNDVVLPGMLVLRPSRFNLLFDASPEQYFSAEVARTALEERGKALASFRKEIGTGKT